MHESDVLIRCEHVSKKFCRDLKTSLWYGIQDVAADFFLVGQRNHRQSPGDQAASDPDAKRAGLRPGEFWAVKDISFELRRGECLGLVGRNGAGKTTLLKMLNGLIKPDHGRIEMRGRVGALIALGAGFNPVLTARENIYVNGSTLGLSRRQITNCFEEIVEFSELGEFIDTPVHSFSSGMQVRLGFAIAVVLIKPDVLLLDEVLAVGDFRFRNKCMSRLTQMLQSCAVILVSHQEGHIRRICDMGMWLQKGERQCIGLVGDVMEAYKSGDSDVYRQDEHFLDERLNQLDLKIGKLRIPFNTNLRVDLLADSLIDVAEIVLRIIFKTIDDVPVAEWVSLNHGLKLSLQKGRQGIPIELQNIRLRSGAYRLEYEVVDWTTKSPLVKRNLDETLTIEPTAAGKFILHNAQQ